MEYIQWPLQVPKLEVPTIFNGLCQGYVRGYIYIYINMYIRYICDTILVGGLEHEFDFSIYIGNVIIPTDELTFSRGVGIPPTRICGMLETKWRNPPWLPMISHDPT